MLKEVVEGITSAVAAFERTPRINSPLFSLLVLALTVLAAFSPYEYISIILLLAGLGFAIYARALKAWAIATALSAAFAAGVSAPALLGLLQSKVDPVLFVARSASSASVLAGGVLATSWWRFVDALKRILPRDLSRALELMPLSIYALGRSAISAAAAREARVFQFDKWAFAAAVGDVLIYGLERGRALRMAHEARSP
ncbi:hypothetical protein [Thermoproteus tenax]|uniref:Cobalt transport protein CbiQ n=1 Tax=Thermoproteus tenax (strain ATCC 35583 / DSM 2078 / JCM 9277 / NBRC 100435 / Kra 1) TaxID=768679 RepID=G4RMT0_THETK|nr:hypothetical protein [Thermoproteus tenax]CCC80874.1 cobalt transport protein CbiQ [Thermoproteus tenax Kra 1]